MSYFRDLGRALVGRAFSEKASAVGPLIARMMLGQPIWPRRNYERLAIEGYQQNPVVSRAVQMTAAAVANIPWVLYQGKGEKRKELDQHPFLDLMLQPNPYQDGVSFLEALVSNYMITGNGYVERTEEKTFERMELYALRPDRMKAIPGAEGAPRAYQYSVNGQTRDFDMDADRGLRPILHLKRFHPVDDWYGMSPLDPAAFAIDVHTAASGWNKSVLENGAAPSGAFVYKGDEKSGNRLADDHFARLKKEAVQMAESSRRGAPLVLDGGLEWITFGMNAEQMQYVDAKHVAAREIAFALGVPPQLLGIPGDNTYSNYQEARQAFYQDTVIPLTRLICRAFTHWFAQSLGKGVVIEPNIDDLDALALVREATWNRVEKSTILSLNEKRDALGYEPVDGGDQHYVGYGSIPLGADAGTFGGGPPDDGEDNAGDEPKPKPKDDGKNIVRLARYKTKG